MAQNERLISLDKAIEYMEKHKEMAKQHNIVLVANEDAIIKFLKEKCPTVDAVEVVHGRWVKHKPKPEAMRAWHRQGIGKAMSENSIFWTCSCCEEWGTPRYNYCPHCGAKMDGGNEDENS